MPYSGGRTKHCSILKRKTVLEILNPTEKKFIWFFDDFKKMWFLLLSNAALPMVLYICTSYCTLRPKRKIVWNWVHNWSHPCYLIQELVQYRCEEKENMLRVRFYSNTFNTDNTGLLMCTIFSRPFSNFVWCLFERKLLQYSGSLYVHSHRQSFIPSHG